MQLVWRRRGRLSLLWSKRHQLRSKCKSLLSTFHHHVPHPATSRTIFHHDSGSYHSSYDVCILCHACIPQIILQAHARTSPFRRSTHLSLLLLLLLSPEAIMQSMLQVGCLIAYLSSIGRSCNLLKASWSSVQLPARVSRPHFAQPCCIVHDEKMKWNEVKNDKALQFNVKTQTW